MKRGALVMLVLVLTLLLACLLRLTIPGGWPDDPMVFSLRLHRIMAAVSVGAFLATAGVILQAVMRNPLASPDVIGVSSGASLAVMLSIYLSSLGLGAVGGYLANASWQTIPALIGAIVVLGILLSLTRAGHRASPVEPTTLLLTGVVISVLCGAGVMFLQYLMPDVGFSAARLLIGTISDDTGRLAAWLLPVVMIVVLTATLQGRTLDALSLSDDEALSVGVNIRVTRPVLLLLAGLCCALAVALAGPIGFIGLIAPHLARSFLGVAHASHRLLIPAAAIVGASIIVLADAAVKAINLGAGRMPIGIITAIVGGPMLIVLLRQSSRGSVHE